MSNRRDTFYRQLVSEADLDQLCNDLEVADRALSSDLGFAGAMTGLVVSQHSAGNYTVDVTGGTAYDSLGQRIVVPSTQNVDLSLDHLGVSTNVATTGHSKVISLSVKFNRQLQNPVTDGHGFTVYYDRLESYAWFVKQGSEAVTGSETPPSKEADGILVANITLAYSASPQAILTGAISTSTRDDLVVLPGTPFSIRRGSYLAALADVVVQLNAISAGSATIPASGVIYAGGGSWAGGASATNPSATAEAQFDKIIADLSALTAGASGADRMGVAALVGASSTIVAGTLFAALTALKSAANLDKAAGGTWADASTPAAATLSSWLNGIVTALGNNLGGASSAGARKIGYYPTNGIPATSVQGALDALGISTATSDGALLIGSSNSAGFTGITVRDQLDELLSSKAGLVDNNHFTGNNTFDNLAMTASYGLSSRSVTRMLSVLPSPSTIPAGGNATIGFTLPHGVVLTNVIVNVVPTAHGAYPPATRPALVLAKQNGITAAVTNVVTDINVDAATTLGGINANRPWTLHAPISETIDRTATPFYALTIDNESGANATSTQIASIAVVCTVTGLDDLPVD